MCAPENERGAGGLDEAGSAAPATELTSSCCVVGNTVAEWGLTAVCMLLIAAEVARAPGDDTSTRVSCWCASLGEQGDC
jgi:hypothetical protein